MDAAKKKSLSSTGLTTLRVLLLLVVGLCLGQTRVWGLDAAPHLAPGQIAVASASAVGEMPPLSPMTCRTPLLPQIQYRRASPVPNNSAKQTQNYKWPLRRVALPMPTLGFVEAQ